MRVVLALAIVAASPAPSAAQCITSTIALSPWQGTLPADPRVFLFVPRGDAYGSFHSTVPIQTRTVVANDDLVVYEIHIHATRGEVTVGYRSRPGRDLSATYTIGDPGPNRADITDIAARTAVCHPTYGIALDVEGNAIALRFVWPDKTFTIVPAYEAEIGHLGHGRDFAVDTVRPFTLVALFADGSERRLGTAKLRASAGRIRLPYELLPRRSIYRGLIDAFPRIDRRTLELCRRLMC